MYPVNNCDEFFHANTSEERVTNFENLERLAYANFIQTRLNTNLLLLKSSALSEHLEYDIDDLIDETKKLAALSRCIDIPELVSEKKRYKR